MGHVLVGPHDDDAAGRARAEVRELLAALRGNNEFDVHRLIGLLKAAQS